MWMGIGNHKAMKLRSIYKERAGELEAICNKHPEIRQISVAIDEKTGRPALVFVVDEGKKGEVDMSGIPTQIGGIDTKILYSAKPIVLKAGHDPRP